MHPNINVADSLFGKPSITTTTVDYKLLYCSIEQNGIAQHWGSENIGSMEILLGV